jgi:hypothetical protein
VPYKGATQATDIAAGQIPVGFGDPEVRRKLEELGFAVRGSSAEALGSMTRDQLAKYERVIRETAIAKE